MNGKPSAGFRSSEFWLMVAKLLVGAGLTVYEPTRLLGAAMLGIGAPDAKSYLAARVELKKNGGA